jgi:hypothetical protein
MEHAEDIIIVIKSESNIWIRQNIWHCAVYIYIYIYIKVAAYNPPTAHTRNEMRTRCEKRYLSHKTIKLYNVSLTAIDNLSCNTRH